MSTDLLERSRIVTPDDLLRLPDEGMGLELVDGEIREVNVSVLSSYVAGVIYSVLKDFVLARRLGWVFPEGISFRCFPFDLNRVRRADAAFIALNRMTLAQAQEEGHCTVVPDLVVEVISPNDLAYDVDAKCDEWLNAGVQLLWVVNPVTRQVRILHPGGIGLLKEFDTLTAEPVLPEFSCPVSDLFRLPVQKA